MRGTVASSSVTTEMTAEKYEATNSASSRSTYQLAVPLSVTNPSSTSASIVDGITLSMSGLKHGARKSALSRRS